LICHNVFSFPFVGATNAQHEDCERPPSIAHGSGRLLVDDNEDVVKAVYNCAPGYELEGKATLNCDLDNDEWQGEPPKCVAGKNYDFHEQQKNC
jgi:fibulin 1/2